MLDVLYPVGAKGVILEWQETLHSRYLGAAAAGFRPGSGTLHVAQLLTELMVLQRRRKRVASRVARGRVRNIILMSFDIEKCFPTLPW